MSDSELMTPSQTVTTTVDDGVMDSGSAPPPPAAEGKKKPTVGNIPMPAMAPPPHQAGAADKNRRAVSSQATDPPSRVATPMDDPDGDASMVLLRSLSSEFSAFRRDYNVRNELALRRLEPQRAMDAAAHMFRLLDEFVARGSHLVETSPLGKGRDKAASATPGVPPEFPMPNFDAGAPLSARSNVDPRVINGSFYGDAAATAALPGSSPGGPSAPVGFTPPKAALTVEALAALDRQPFPNQSMLPGVRVGAASNDSLSSGAVSDDLAEDTKFSQSMTSMGEVDELFDSVNDYILMDELGRGQTGRVMRGVHADTGQSYAIKVLPRSLIVHKRKDAKSSKDAVVSFKREVQVMKKLKSKRIVRLIEVIDDPDEDTVYLVMPLLEKGPMIKFTPERTCEKAPLDVAKRYIKDIVAGLQYLKRHRIVHRDLKPDNILLTEDDRCVLVDFGQSEWGNHEDFGVDEDDQGSDGGGPPGSARSHGSNSSEGGGGQHDDRPGMGTPAFAAPEVIGGATPDYPADVWSLGIIIYCLVYGHLPFRTRNRQELFDMILNDEPEWDEDVDFLWNDLIQACLMKEPASRLPLADLRRHPALRSGAAGSQTASSVGSELDNSMIGVTPEYEMLDDPLAMVSAKGKRSAFLAVPGAGGPPARAGGRAGMPGSSSNLADSLNAGPRPAQGGKLGSPGGSGITPPAGQELASAYGKRGALDADGPGAPPQQQPPVRRHPVNLADSLSGSEEEAPAYIASPISRQRQGRFKLGGA